MSLCLYLLIFCTGDENASGERSIRGCENSEEAAEMRRAVLGQVGIREMQMSCICVTTAVFSSA